ncbi:response regulator [Candidatus Nitrosotenuis cloacae]|uniref:response regulator n=1 Tax=Candidatus Nitrosotenuis cloacae TaxID=1603555 RepID=UPI0022816E6C|nr:response regulator [Candidatus Nitrosotenuis cloacae]
MISAIVIDDDRDTVSIFVDYLEMLNVDVWAVGYDGKQAVDLYRTHGPDMMFLDMMMPEYDGLYALKEIRRINPDAKVIVVTADMRKDTEDRLSLLNPTEVIYKPFDPVVLKALIEKHGTSKTSITS